MNNVGNGSRYYCEFHANSSAGVKEGSLVRSPCASVISASVVHVSAGAGCVRPKAICGL